MTSPDQSGIFSRKRTQGAQRQSIQTALLCDLCVLSRLHFRVNHRSSRDIKVLPSFQQFISGLSTKGLLGTGLEPARLAARASKTRMSAIPSPERGDWKTVITPRFHVQEAQSSNGASSGNPTATMSNHRKGEEYPAKSGIIVTLKFNPSGSRAYRVDIPATITGLLREQRQFLTKEKARDYAAQRHLEITQFGHAAFALTSRQRDDATRAIALLSPHGLTLEAAANVALKHLPKVQAQTTVTTLRTLFLKAPGKRRAKLTSRRSQTLQNLTWRTARFEKTFGSHNASTLRTEQVREWLSSLGKLSPVSLNNERRVLHAMFSFAVNEGYCVANPITKVPLYHIPEKAPAILGVEQAERLIRVAADTDSTLGLLGYITLGLFAGLRSTEIKMLDWTAVKPERRMVTVDGSIAKSGSIRNVALADNAMAWLGACAARTGSVSPRNLNHRLHRLRFLAGIDQWHGNELRHSFASYHFDLHQNAPLTAAMLGHNSGTQLLFEHYRSLVPLGDGERFFAIRPVGVAQTQLAETALPA